jgi:hypothetical protein
MYNQVMNAATARDIEVEAYNLRTRGGFEIDFVFKIQAGNWGRRLYFCNPFNMLPLPRTCINTLLKQTTLRVEAW